MIFKYVSFCSVNFELIDATIYSIEKDFDWPWKYDNGYNADIKRPFLEPQTNVFLE